MTHIILSSLLLTITIIIIIICYTSSYSIVVTI